MSTFGDGDVVRNLVDAGMAAIQSAVVNEGAEILKKNEKAKRYVKTGLNVMKALDSVVSLNDEDPEQTTCRFQCPTNDRGVQGRAFRRLDHSPSSNGCGSYGFRFEDANFPAVTSCCHAHDLCYDECGSAKDDCDADFRRCLESVCGASSDCDAIKDGLLFAVVSFGCDAFLNAQTNACVCV